MDKKSKGKAKARRPKAKKPKGAKKAPAARSSTIDGGVFNAGMHDFTNLATAVRAYLELLSSQGALDEKQKYYVARSREQVEMMIDLVRELKEKL
jgi:signal transduction histidine kinase